MRIGGGGPPEDSVANDWRKKKLAKIIEIDSTRAVGKQHNRGVQKPDSLDKVDKVTFSIWKVIIEDYIEPGRGSLVDFEK